MKTLVSLISKGFIISCVPKASFEVFGVLSPLPSLPGFTQEPFQIYLTRLETWSLFDALKEYPNCLLSTTVNFFLLAS